MQFSVWAAPRPGLDAAGICAVARQYGATSLLDASPTAGLLDLAVGADALVGSAHPTADRVAAALASRYFKRIAAHARNIVTSVVMPLDKIDFFDDR